MYRRVLVPLDGSALAERALPHAERLVAAGGELRLVEVVQPGPVIPALGTREIAGAAQAEALMRELRDAIDRPRKEAAAYLDRVRARITRPDVAVTTEVLEGHAVGRLVEAAGDVDLRVVLSSHGRTGLTRSLLGSVAERVVRHATVPVLVVR